MGCLSSTSQNKDISSQIASKSSILENRNARRQVLNDITNKIDELNNKKDNSNIKEKIDMIKECESYDNISQICEEFVVSNNSHKKLDALETKAERSKKNIDINHNTIKIKYRTLTDLNLNIPSEDLD